MIETEAELEGRRLTLEEQIGFACHAGLACFNRCCRDKRLPLLPYDLLRLRGALGLGSQELLARHAELELDAESGWPTLRIRLEEDGRCPFVREAGCAVYEHRPTCCRIYPLTRAVRPGPTPEDPPTELFLALEPPGCLGWGERRGELTLSRFLEEQGLTPYHRANNRLLRLLLHPARPRPLVLDERKLHTVILALYNLDLWREAVSTPGFADRFGVAPARLEAARAGEQALSELGQDWLAAELFGDRSALLG